MYFEILLILIFLGLVIGCVLAVREINQNERRRREENLQHWIDRKGFTRYPGEE